MKFEKSMLTTIDSLIRNGKHGIANEHLNHLLHLETPREDMHAVAALARRLSRSEIGISTLNPIVRPSGRKPTIATDQEKTEYAACLIRLGALNEALLLLDTISIQIHPHALMFRAFAHIARWDFKKSGICLEDFIRLSPEASYDVLIAKVNLAVGYVFLEEYHKAIPLLEELCEITQRTGNLLLHSNSLELLAQAFITKGDYSRAEVYLERAENVLVTSDTIDAFFVKKSRAILKLFKNSASDSSLRDIRAIKEEARKRRFWEQLRDCDYSIALATKNKKLIEHLYFGTPFESYRKHMLSKMDFSYQELNNKYKFSVGHNSKQSIIEIDVNTGCSTISDLRLKEGQVPQRLLSLLASDFYRPKRILEIFDGLFPNEYFSPQSSRDKIHQALRRLRSFLDEARVPLVIKEQKGFYSLDAKNDSVVNMICYKEQHLGLKKTYLYQHREQKTLDLLTAFKQSTSSRDFDVVTFARACKTSERTALRHLSLAIQKGWVRKDGAARFTRYQLARFCQALKKNR